MITIEAFQQAVLHSNSQNLLQYQLKNEFPLLKLLRRNKLNNGRSQIFSGILFYGKFLLITYYYQKNFENSEIMQRN